MYCLNYFNMNVLEKHLKLIQTTTENMKAKDNAQVSSVLIVIIDKALNLCHELSKLLQEHYKLYVSTESCA